MNSFPHSRSIPARLGALSVLLVLLVSACGPVETPSSATGLLLDRNDLTLQEGNTHLLTANIIPESAAATSVVLWTSSDETVATVADGLVSALSIGTTSIIAKIENTAIADTCVVTVAAPLTLSIVYDVNQTAAIAGYPGIQKQLTAVWSDNSTATDVVWNSTNTNAATINNTGLLTLTGAPVAGTSEMTPRLPFRRRPTVKQLR